MKSYQTNIEEHFSLEKIKTEQNYKGVDIQKIDELIAAADIQEPLDELLKMI